MPVEMIGWIAPRVSSEIIPAQGPAFSADVVAETAHIHGDAEVHDTCLYTELAAAIAGRAAIQ